MGVFDEIHSEGKHEKVTISEANSNNFSTVTCSEHGRLEGGGGINACRDIARKHISKHNTMSNPVDLYEGKEKVETYG